MSDAKDIPADSAERPAKLPSSVSCVRCLTSLGGVRLDGVCPKCELPAAVSVPAPVRIMIKKGLSRAPRGLSCQRCGRTLEGLKLKENCPQCTLVVEQSIVGGDWQSALDEHDAVLADLACVRCGYNLKSLREDGKCPECGISIDSSTRGHFLYRSNPKWVRGLAIGCWIISLSTALVTAAIFVGFALLFSAPPGPNAAEVLWQLVIPGAALLGCLGVWIMTGREHGWHMSNEVRRSRRWARVGLTAGICLPILPSIVILPGALGAAGVSALHWFILLFVTCVGFWIGVPSYFVYVRYLCARIPNQRLLERAAMLRTASTLSLVSFSICIVAGLAIGALGGSRFGLVTAVATAIAITGGAVSMVFLCVTCVFHFRLSEALHCEANAARGNASETGK